MRFDEAEYHGTRDDAWTSLCNIAKHGQSTIGRSSGESEWYGLVKGSAAGLGLQSMLRDWGILVSLDVLSGCSAARRFSSCQGLGRMRHVQTRYLWVQECKRGFEKAI